ncbi:MAG: hypothetical protein AB7I19_09580 [Planctomycetota bacterium]
MKRTLLPILPLLVAQTALAQAETTTATSPLVVTTTDKMIARAMARNFGGEAKLEELSDGGAYVLSLDDGGKVAIRQGEARGWMHIDAKPAALMRVFSQQVQQGRMMASMMGGMALSQAGIDSADVGDIVDAVFDFPKQLDGLTVAIADKIEQGKPIAIDIAMAPKADTWFGKLVGGLRQHPAGFRKLPGADAMVTMDADVDFSAVTPLIRPMMDKMMGMMIQDEDLMASAKEMYDVYYQNLAGPMSLTFDGTFSMQMLAEVKDTSAMQEIMGSEAWAKLAKAAGEMNDMATVTMNPNVGTHRDVTIMSSVTEMSEDAPESPFMKGNKVEQFMAVAGDAVLMTSANGGLDGIKSLIDGAMDNKKFKRGPLAGGQLVAIGVDVMKLMDMMSQMTGGEPEGEIPARADVSVGKTGGSLTMAIRVK